MCCLAWRSSDRASVLTPWLRGAGCSLLGHRAVTVTSGGLEGAGVWWSARGAARRYNPRTRVLSARSHRRSSASADAYAQGLAETEAAVRSRCPDDPARGRLHDPRGGNDRPALGAPHAADLDPDREVRGALRLRPPAYLAPDHGRGPGHLPLGHLVGRRQPVPHPGPAGRDRHPGERPGALPDGARVRVRPASAGARDLAAPGPPGAGARAGSPPVGARVPEPRGPQRKWRFGGRVQGRGADPRGPRVPAAGDRRG